MRGHALAHRAGLRILHELSLYISPHLFQQEALQCVQEMNSTQLLFVFVRNGLESTLERSTIAREHMGLLLYQLYKTELLPTQQYYKGSVWKKKYKEKNTFCFTKFSVTRRKFLFFSPLFFTLLKCFIHINLLFIPHSFTH